MNTAPGHKTEELADERLVERRNVMRLVPCDSSKKRGKLRIDVDDGLLYTPKGKVATPEDREKDTTRDPGPVDLGTYGSVIAVATAVGLAVGYLLGRRNDR